MNFMKKVVFISIITLFSAMSSMVCGDGTEDYCADILTKSEDAVKGDIEEKIIRFKNNDLFSISKISPYPSGGHIEKTIFLPGEHIEVSFFDSKENFVKQLSHLHLPLKTLYIKTTACNAVLSIGAVYNVDSKYSTIVPNFKKEVPLTAEAVESPVRGYVFTGNFDLLPSEIGEFWYIVSENTDDKFYDMDDEYTKTALRINEMSKDEIRLCHDGFYFKAPTTYTPYRENMLYKQPSCYTGVSFARYGQSPLLDELGYAIMRLSLQNQNEKGFWPTTLTVDWLKSDFNIKNNFYDTRFNTDMATGLVTTYEKYHDKYFLNALFRYTEYFINHAQTLNIESTNGILVRDYAGDENSLKTHSSLNHHASEIIYLNFLYDMLRTLDEETKMYFQNYEFVKDPEIISTLSSKMLKGIEDTEDFWIMKNGNLRYAYGYTGTSNTMLDYPYLTYNDLLILNNQIKEKNGEGNEVIERLMTSKKLWMDENNITGYLK